MECPSCGALQESDRRFCASCGAELRPALVPLDPAAPQLAPAIAPPRAGAEPRLGRTPRPAAPREEPLPPKSVGLAALLGLVPGLGQIYTGQMAKGATLLLATLIAYVVLGILTSGLYCLCIAPIVPFLSAFDAAMVARRVNEGEEVSPWQFY